MELKGCECLCYWEHEDDAGIHYMELKGRLSLRRNGGLGFQQESITWN